MKTVVDEIMGAARVSRRYVVVFEEWTGTVWMRRKTAPFEDEKAEKFYNQICKETCMGRLNRNVAVEEA